MQVLDSNSLVTSGVREQAARLGRRLRPSAPAALIIVALAVALSLPMITTRSGMSQDWPNHLWFLWQQGLNIHRDGVPSLFVTQGSSIFYPFYAFYGGTVYSLGGLLSLVLGDAPVKAYVLSYILGFVAALGAFYWLALTAGVGRWLAHVPGFVFVTSSYVLTDVYARGAWPEFIAVCSIPVVVAAGLAVLRDQRLRLVPAAMLALGTIVLFGSHNITMLWGITFLALVAATVVILVPPARGLITRAGLVRLTAVVVPAILVDAWFLLPAVTYGSRTAAGHGNNLALLQSTSVLVDARRLFTLSRESSVNGTAGAPNAPDFALSLPLLAMAWTPIAAMVATLRDRGAWLMRVTWILIAWGIAFAIVMTHLELIEALPKPYQFVQFQYRISSYILLALSGAMIGPLRHISSNRQSAERLVALALVPVLLVAAEGAVIQIAAFPAKVPDRNIVFAASAQPPPTMYSLDDYYDDSLPVVPAPSQILFFPPSAIAHDSLSVHYPASLDGARVQTNLLAAPYLIQVHGARVLGRSPNGRMVLALAAAGPNAGTVTLARSDRLPLVIGRVLSLLGLLGTFACLTWCAWTSLARRGDVTATQRS